VLLKGIGLRGGEKKGEYNESYRVMEVIRVEKGVVGFYMRGIFN
jgi:hypothetical protein